MFKVVRGVISWRKLSINDVAQAVEPLSHGMGGRLLSSL